MGMFDYIRCKVPLPDGLDTGDPERSFQTKCLLCRLDEFEIREDGTLWHQDYSVEDRSNPDAEGLESLYGIRTRVNQKWIQWPDFTGEIVLSYRDSEKGLMKISTYFARGKLKHIEPLISPQQHRTNAPQRHAQELSSNP